MEYDLARIYETLANGETLEDAKPGKSVEIRGWIGGFRIPSGGKITYLLQNVTGPELRIEYGEAVIGVGKKYMSLFKVPDTMEPLVRYLDNHIIGELDE